MVKSLVVNNAIIIEPQDKALDARTSKDFRRDIQELLEQHKHVVLDLSALTFIDSSGLGVLLSCLRQLTGNGGDLKLCSLTPQVRAVFQLVRMHRLFDVYNTRDEAAQAFSFLA
jgi:anti-sigma B factor antagonist